MKRVSIQIDDNPVWAAYPPREGQDYLLIINPANGKSAWVTFELLDDGLPQIVIGAINSLREGRGDDE